MNHVPFNMPTDTDRTVRALGVYLATLGNARLRADPFVAETLGGFVHARAQWGLGGLDEFGVVYPQMPSAIMQAVPAPEDDGPVLRQDGPCWRCAVSAEAAVPQRLTMAWVAHHDRNVVEFGFCDDCRDDLEQYGPTWKAVPDATV